MTGEDIIKASERCKMKQCKGCPLNGVHLCDKIVDIYKGTKQEVLHYCPSCGQVVKQR